MRRDAMIDSEWFYSADLSIQHMCAKKYFSQSYSYLWSFVTDGYRWAGTPQEFRENYVAQAIIADSNTNLWAVNSNFDFQGAEKEFPELGITKRPWQCVSDYAVHHQRPRSLASLHYTLTGRPHSKTMRNVMKGRHFCEFLGFEQDNVKAMNLADSDVALEDLGELRKLGPMSQTEREVAAHTRMICRRGINTDPEYIEKCRQALTWIRHNAKQKLPWFEVDTPLSVQAFNTWSCKQGVAPPNNLKKDGADFTDWMEANPKLAPVMRARQAFELSNRKLSHIEKFLSKCHEGIYYPDLLYCGAPHTRRWSAKGSSDGSQTDGDDTHSGFNIQNMDREPLFGDIVPDFISPLPPVKKGQPQPGIFFRNFLVPRPGKKFVVLDFAQVEPRCLFWLAQCEKLLQMVREGYSIYEAFARTTGMWNEPGKLKETAPTAYYVKVKNAAIGSGYGMGGPRFSKYAKIPVQEATDLIQLIRANNPSVPGFWRRLQSLCVRAAQEKAPLEIQMPNGSMFRYFNVTKYERHTDEGAVMYAYRGDKVLGELNPKNTADIYGGRLTENVTQRMARDLVAEAILRLEKAGLPVCFHAHDEIVVEVDEADAKEAFIRGRQIMEMVPDWAYGLPIGTSGGVYDRYCKAD
jgi:DNA polymerase